jgi:hypothetical protein
MPPMSRQDSGCAARHAPVPSGDESDATHERYGLVTPDRPFRLVGRLVLFLQSARRRASAAIHDRLRASRTSCDCTAVIHLSERATHVHLADDLDCIPRHGTAEQRHSVHADRVRRNAHRERTGIDFQCYDAAVHRLVGPLPHRRRPDAWKSLRHPARAGWRLDSDRPERNAKA